ncbi:PBSX family phage terminase large subunit [Paenibacillus polymyxa]|uniref:PBSX family phage terminase large subunit n=1 Tax=Paenibacillus polymyxa TaxID=1406 RepID=UPI002ED489B4|nr:PBSX family phage terminase large subunit [Paenibacillus polymyxa]
MTKLTDLIAPSFYDIHHDLKKGRHTHYWLKGGRGSTKSSFISIEIILGMMKDPKANAVVLRKVGLYLKDSVFEQLQWAIEVLGVENYWHAKLSPLELVYVPTGQRIIFRGADKPKKIKSTKVKNGYIKYIWYEEVDEFTGPEEIRTIKQSLMRGGEGFVAFYSFNPPKSQRNWVNDEVTESRPDRVVHHSTYLTVPRRWLGGQFFIEAEHLQKTKPDSYRHEYMGEVTGTGGEVFTNLTIREITDEEISIFDQLRRGIDFGYAKDPAHYGVMHYDKKKRRLYIFHELHKVQLHNRKAAEHIKAENKSNGLVMADSSEPKSIAEIKEYGIRIRGAKKGPDSVEYGIKFLESLEEIIIDPVRCPNTKREFYGYELEPDGNGGFKAGYPDRDNHSIDMTRYALENDMKAPTFEF